MKEGMELCFGRVCAVGMLVLALGLAAEGRETVRPQVGLADAPMKPSAYPDSGQSVLLGHSAFKANINLDLRYEPLEDGGFVLPGNSPYKFSFNRHIVQGRNTLMTGDIPIFRLETTTGSGVYANDRSFPLFPRPDARSAQVAPVLGTLEIGVSNHGKTVRLDKANIEKSIFRPGYTSYEISAPDHSWSCSMRVAPILESHGLVCRLRFDKPVALDWRYGGIFWTPDEKNIKKPAELYRDKFVAEPCNNQVSIRGNFAEITENNLPRAHVFVGWDGTGKGRSVDSDYGKAVRFVSSGKQKEFYIVAAWGVDGYDRKLANELMARLDTPNAARWPEERDELKREWFDCMIGRALDPEKKFKAVLKNPGAELEKTCAHWDARRNEFQISTPDPYLDAVVNFERCVSEYHRFGPGLVLSSNPWMMYSHISVGWYGKIWGGDLKTIDRYMRLFGAMQADDGYINWISPSLFPYHAENNTPYWIDQIWWLYAWSGDKTLISDLWPAIQKAVEWERNTEDPDGDGLYQSFYEYWNCDSNGKGPKAAMPTTTAWTMFDHVANMARLMGEPDKAAAYRQEAEKIRSQAFKQLWSDQEGILGSIGGNGVWRGHPQTWEQYTGIVNGMTPPDKGRRAMRWLEAHYGFNPAEGVNLLMNCDWWPLRWSVHWVPVGDTLIAAMAGMKCGDTELWWPYFKTAIMSAFRTDTPAVRFAISNTGSGGSGVEFVDADDPHMHSTLRGLFGITPEVQNGRIRIEPAFPADWKSAELRSPLVSCTYKRQGNQVVMKITTPQPLVKVVRCAFGAEPVTTPCETVSVVRATLPARKGAPLLSQPRKNICVDKLPPQSEPAIGKADRDRLVLLDLGDSYNTTLSNMCTKTRFIADYGGPTTIESWWHTVPGKMNEGPEIVTASNGVDFLLRNRSASVKGKANNLLALSSWGVPYPYPAAATFPVGRRLEKFWLLTLNYVSPIKNYIPNGEIVLHYASGEPDMVSLVPPYNMDCYFQRFSRKGVSVPLGTLTWPSGWIPCEKSQCEAQANALAVACDPSRTLESIEIRATVSEGVIGVAGMTLLPVDGH